MSTLLVVLGHFLIACGIGFLLLAALGLWRLPDLLSRLHTLTKADTAGLTLVALGAVCLSGTVTATLSLVLCVLLVAVSGATVGHLIAKDRLERETS